MNAFHIYPDKAGYYRWRLVARNGEKVAASEAYSSKDAAKKSAEEVKIWSSTAIIVEDEPIRLDLNRLFRK